MIIPDPTGSCEEMCKGMENCDIWTSTIDENNLIPTCYMSKYKKFTKNNINKYSKSGHAPNYHPTLEYNYGVNGIQPFFVNPAYLTGSTGPADYHLAPDSPGINFGDPNNQPSDSLGSLGEDGFIRDDGPARDASHHSAGAYEYQGETPQECVDLTALTNYITNWKQGSLSMPSLMQKIESWKAGTGC